MHTLESYQTLKATGELQKRKRAGKGTMLGGDEYLQVQDLRFRGGKAASLGLAWARV